jgi:hypothetical protein
MQVNRRGLITGLASFVAAPAILRVSRPMRISMWRETEAVIDVLDGEFDEDPTRPRGIELSAERAIERALLEYWQRRDERVARLYRHDRMLRARGQRRA